jgi:nucleotide sugar dehydrogenase
MYPPIEDFSIDEFTSSETFHTKSWNSAAFRHHVPVTPPSEEVVDAFFKRTQEFCHPPVTDDESPIVAVIGVGYVGLHLVAAFSRLYNVIAFDISPKRLASVADQLPKSASLTLTSDASCLAAATHFLVSVPTLLVPGTSVVDTSKLQNALDTIFACARIGSTIIIESSVAVGMTRSLLGKMVQERQLKACMSPEVGTFESHCIYNAYQFYQRVDPGRINPSFESIPKIISGLDDLAPGSLSSIEKLYSPIFKTLVPVSSPEVAEMTKLYENCQRMLCIAYANEMADACQALPMPIDPFEVSRAAATKPFGYLPFLPSAGVGGHCIPVNPYYLFSTSEFPLLRCATEKMAGRPVAIADRTMRILYSAERFITGKPRVLVVGVAFKPGQHVLSHSPGVKIINHLVDYWKADVSFADPLVKEESVPQAPKLDEEIRWNIEDLSNFDAIIVVIKQVGLNFDVLEGLEGTLVKWCCQ